MTATTTMTTTPPMLVNDDRDHAVKAQGRHSVSIPIPLFPTSRKLSISAGMASKFTPPPGQPLEHNAMPQKLHDMINGQTPYGAVNSQLAENIWKALAPNGYDGAAGTLVSEAGGTLLPVHIQVVHLPAVKSFMPGASGADAVALLARYEKRFPHTRTLLIAKSYDEDDDNEDTRPAVGVATEHDKMDVTPCARGRSRSPHREPHMESRQHFVDVSNWFSFDAKFTDAKHARFRI